MFCSFISILRVCVRLQLTAVTMPKEREQGSSVSTVAVNDDSGTAISPAISGLIKSSVAQSIGAFTHNLT